MKILGKSFIMFGIAAFFATGFAFRAQAEPGYYGCGGCWGQPALTAEQQMQAKKIFDESYEKTRKIRQTLGAKRAELDALLSSQDPDKVKIEDISREIGELRGNMISDRVEVRSKLAKAGLPADLYGTEGFEENGGWKRGVHSHGHHRARFWE